MASARLYNAVANKLRHHVDMAKECHDDDATIGLEIAAKAVAQVFEDDNPRFDRERFLKACGIG